MDIITNFNNLYDGNLHSSHINNNDNNNDKIIIKDVINNYQDFVLLNNTELKIYSPIYSNTLNQNDLFIGVKVNIEISDLKFKIKNLNTEYIIDSFIENNLYKLSKYPIPITNNMKFEISCIISFDKKSISDNKNKILLSYYYGSLSKKSKEEIYRCPIFELDKINIVCGYIYIK